MASDTPELEPASCPRCGSDAVGATECARCGVVFAKIARKPSVFRVSPLRHRDGGISALDWILLSVAAIAGVAALIAYSGNHSRPQNALQQASMAQPTTRHLASDANEDPADSYPPYLVGTPPEIHQAESRAPAPYPPAAGDARGTYLSDPALAALVDRSRRGEELDGAAISLAEALYVKYAAEAGARARIEELFLREAGKRKDRREAADILERALQLRPVWPEAQERLFNVWLQAEDWRAAEMAARRVLVGDPRSFFALRALGKALIRQERGDEAARVLRQALDIRADSEVAWLLRELQRESSVATGFARIETGHFIAHFEGDPRAHVGREVLAALERRYSDVAQQLDCAPNGQISVLLYTGAQFGAASRAPSWAGAYFDPADGRIRVSVGGLFETVPPPVEHTLAHELVHAFVHAGTHGKMPSVMNEGLAQYASGDRAGNFLRLEQAQTIKGSGSYSVGDFYVAALSFVEYLVGRDGMMSMNTLIRHLGQGSDFNAAFKRSFGQTYDDAYESWVKQLRS